MGGKLVQTGLIPDRQASSDSKEDRAMPFRESNPMEERIALFREYETGAFSVKELCARSAPCSAARSKRR